MGLNCPGIKGLGSVIHDGYISVGADCPAPTDFLRNTGHLGRFVQIRDNRSLM